MSQSSGGGGGTEVFAVGKDCDAWCGRCKETTNHTVVAMVADKPKQVACGRCGDWHGYGRPRRAAAPGAPAPRKRAAAPSVPRRGRVKKAPVSSATARERWQAALDAATGEPMDYDYRGGYAVGDVVDHPTHGLCVVQTIETPRRAIVLSKDGERALLTPGARNR